MQYFLSENAQEGCSVAQNIIIKCMMQTGGRELDFPGLISNPLMLKAQNLHYS